MTDEDKKRIVSEPPPPTDEIDGEWGDDDETLVRDAPSLSDPPKVSVRPSGSPSTPSGSASSVPPAKTVSAPPAAASVPPAKTASAPPAAASLPPAKTPPAAPAPAASVSVAPAAAAATTPVPNAPPAAASDEDEDDEEDDDETEASDGEDEDEDEDDEEDDDASAQPLHAAASTKPAQDWIPEWGPFAVLGLLVCFSILFGLGLLGGPAASTENNEGKAEPTPSAKPVLKPSAHP